MEANDYLKDKFRADVFKEIENYIGYVYGDDYHSIDKLIVNSFDMSVSHGVRIENSTQLKMDYFDTFGLIKRSGTFTFEPLVDSIDLKTKDGLVEVTEDEYGWDGYLERELRFLVRRNKQGDFTFQDDKLMRLAAELLLNYGLAKKA